MSMTADLRDLLKAAEEVGTNVFRGLRPQGSGLPAVWFQVISAPVDTLMKGEQALNPTRVQVNCLAESRGDADALAEAVLAARPVRASFGDTHFERLIKENAFEDDEPQPGANTIFRTRIDLIVWSRPLS